MEMVCSQSVIIFYKQTFFMLNKKIRIGFYLTRATPSTCVLSPLQTASITFYGFPSAMPFFCHSPVRARCVEYMINSCAVTRFPKLSCGLVPCHGWLCLDRVEVALFCIFLFR
ncbi:hypothetical protein ATANTOWER_023470 [Ataeniobius toweri]|uniref:Uncharacterized protein n=1 Tax=Ataeniobius toweri TaxID=208326 RepID=A0ABU7AI00_9TELE|nr:hypothetical protein [Ataeniobius toweri]